MVRLTPPAHFRSGNSGWSSGWHGLEHRSRSTTAARSGARADRSCSWHRVPAAGVKGMAARDPPKRHAPPAPPAVAADRLIAVLGTAWCEATARHQTEQWAKRHPIDPDEGERCRRHCPQLFAHNISISWRSRANSASPARARATITTSRPPFARVTRGRTSSRNRRLILFRTTALPSFRLTARPTRGRPSSLSLTNTARYAEAARRPERSVRSKSAERSSRECRFNAQEGEATGSAGLRSASTDDGLSDGGL